MSEIEFNALPDTTVWVISEAGLPIWEERSSQPQAMRGKELFCYRSVSLLVQRYNAVLLRDTLTAPNCMDFL